MRFYSLRVCVLPSCQGSGRSQSHTLFALVVVSWWVAKHGIPRTPKHLDKVYLESLKYVDMVFLGYLEHVV